MQVFKVGAGLSLCLGLAGGASAATVAVRPITLAESPGYSMTVTGTISTQDGTSTITGWNLVVTTLELLGHYTPQNTVADLSQVEATAGGQLTVATSVDPGVEDGGVLALHSPVPFQDFAVALANFTTPFDSIGQAFYSAGAAFDFLDLGQPAGTSYAAATANPAVQNEFAVTPLSFTGGVSMFGTITTDGTTGPLLASNLVDWDISVGMMTQDLFDTSNSTLQADLLSLAPDGTLTVDNPGGFLGFLKGISGGHPYSLVLADFTDTAPAGGQAGYFQGRLASTTVGLNARRGPWAITGDAPVVSPVPVPASALLLGSVMLGLAGLGARRRAHA